MGARHAVSLPTWRLGTRLESLPAVSGLSESLSVGSETLGSRGFVDFSCLPVGWVVNMQCLIVLP